MNPASVALTIMIIIIITLRIQLHHIIGPQYL